MAVTRATSFAAGTIISNTAARVSAITLDTPTDGTTGNFCVMIYDKATAPAGGTDTPELAWMVRIPSASGNKGKHKIPLPGGGIRCATGVGLFVATAFNGATGVTTTAPGAVDVFFEPGN